MTLHFFFFLIAEYRERTKLDEDDNGIWSAIPPPKKQYNFELRNEVEWQEELKASVAIMQSIEQQSGKQQVNVGQTPKKVGPLSAITNKLMSPSKLTPRASTRTLKFASPLKFMKVSTTVNNENQTPQHQNISKA